MSGVEVPEHSRQACWFGCLTAMEATLEPTKSQVQFEAIIWEAVLDNCTNSNGQLSPSFLYRFEFLRR